MGIDSDFSLLIKLGYVFWDLEEGRRDVQSPQGAGDCRRGWGCSRDSVRRLLPSPSRPGSRLPHRLSLAVFSRAQLLGREVPRPGPPPGPRTQSPGCRSAPGGTAGHFCVCPAALGTFAVLSLMTGSAVERLVPEPLGGNLSGIEREQLDAQRVGAAAALAFGSGALMVREDPGDGGRSTLGAWGN